MTYLSQQFFIVPLILRQPSPKMAAPQTIPDFDDLPKIEGMPQGCAWGIFDKDGKKDYGTLNLLTPDVVAAAATEVKEGISVSLK